jgi:hypothetical protein
MRRLLAGGLLAVLLIVPAPAAPDKAKPAPADDAADIADKLLERTDLDGFEQTSFRSAVAMLQEKLGYTILVDHRSLLPAIGAEENNRQALEERMITLPAMKKVRLATVLREILDQIGADYYIEADHIKVTTPFMKELVIGPYRTLPDLRPSDGESAAELGDSAVRVRHTPTVTAVFKDVPLADALRAVSLRAGRAVAVNPGAGEKAKAPVSVALNNAPFDTAVAVLAEAAGLRAFRTGNAAVLVTPERAAKIEAVPTGLGGLCGGVPGIPSEADRQRQALEEKVRLLSDEVEKLKKK